jgi:hypothetical protein
MKSCDHVTTPPSQLEREIAEVLDTDRSTHGTVVEYAVQNLFKRQGPKKAAENTRCFDRAAD